MKTTVDIILLPFYIFIVMAGVLGNALFIVVVRKHRSMYTTTNFLLTNVAVSDIISLVFFVPGMVLRFFEHPSGNFGSFLCKFVTMHHVAGISLLVSGLTLTLISAERYNALLQPIHLHLKLEKRRVVIAICLIWGFAIAFVSPLFIEQNYVDEVQDCHLNWNSNVSRAYWALLATIVGISLFIMTFCYFQIVKALYFENILPHNCSSSTEQDIKDKQKIIKILITVTVLFFVCFFPFIIVSAINISTESTLYKFSYFLVYTSCFVNPVVYVFQSAKYRAGLKELWKGRPAQRRQRSLES